MADDEEKTVSVRMGKELRDITLTEAKKLASLAQKKGIEDLKFTKDGELFDPLARVPQERSGLEAFGRSALDTWGMGLDAVGAMLAPTRDDRAAGPGVDAGLMPAREQSLEAAAEWELAQSDAADQHPVASMAGSMAGGLAASAPYLAPGTAIAKMLGAQGVKAALKNRAGAAAATAAGEGLAQGTVRGASESYAGGEEDLMSIAGDAAQQGAAEAVMGATVAPLFPALGMGARKYKDSLREGTGLGVLDEAVDGDATSWTGGLMGLRKTPMAKSIEVERAAKSGGDIGSKRGVETTTAESPAGVIAGKMANAATVAARRAWKQATAQMGMENEKFFNTQEGRRLVPTDELVEQVDELITRFSGKGNKPPPWMKVDQLKHARNFLVRDIKGSHGNLREIQKEIQAVEAAIKQDQPKWALDELESQLEGLKGIYKDAQSTAVPVKLKARELNDAMKAIDELAQAGEAQGDKTGHARRLSRMMHEFREKHWGDTDWPQTKKRHSQLIREHKEDIAFALEYDPSEGAPGPMELKKAKAAVMRGAYDESRDKVIRRLVDRMEASESTQRDELLKLAELPEHQQPLWFQDLTSPLDRPRMLAGVEEKPRPRQFDDLYRQAKGQAVYEKQVGGRDHVSEMFGMSSQAVNKLPVWRGAAHRMDRLADYLERYAGSTRASIVVPGMVRPLVMPDAASPGERLEAAASTLPDAGKAAFRLMSAEEDDDAR